MSHDHFVSGGLGIFGGLALVAGGIALSVAATPVAVALGLASLLGAAVTIAGIRAAENSFSPSTFALAAGASAVIGLSFAFNTSRTFEEIERAQPTLFEEKSSFVPTFNNASKGSLYSSFEELQTRPLLSLNHGQKLRA